MKKRITKEWVEKFIDLVKNAPVLSQEVEERYDALCFVNPTDAEEKSGYPGKGSPIALGMKRHLAIEIQLAVMEERQRVKHILLELEHASSETGISWVRLRKALQ